MLRRAACLLAVTATVAGLVTTPITTAAAAPSPQQGTRAASLEPWRAVAQAVQARATSAHRVELSWTAPRDRDYAGLIIRRTTGVVAPTTTSGVPVAHVDARAHSYLDDEVTPGRTYSYALFARNTSGRLGPAASAQVRLPRATRTILAGSPAHPKIAPQPHATGRITGTVTDATSGEPIANIGVTVFSTDGDYLSQVATDSSGVYRSGLLAPSATGYLVCFDSYHSAFPTSPTGYSDECYDDAAWQGDPFQLPADATLVPVVGGATTPGIDAALSPGGSIAGRVTTTSGAPIEDVLVTVAVNGEGDTFGIYTDANGRYRFNGLDPASYSICFDGRGATGPSAYGYVGSCYKDQPYDGNDVPPGITFVAVTATTVHSGINAKLAEAGGMSGSVTSSDGSPLHDYDVTVFDSDGSYVDAYTDYNADGTFHVRALPAGSYYVCFSGQNATGGTSTTGYMPQCYDDVAWDGFGPPPDAIPVTVTAGMQTDGVDASLDAAGEISGTVVSSATGNGIRDVDVNVLTTDGDYVADQFTATDGSYEVAGLPASGGYVICFATYSAHGGGSTTGYLPECYDNVPWDGFSPPTGATAVPVDAGSTATVDAQLDPAGAISGTVTAASDGAGLADVNVVVFDGNGNDVGGAQTSGTGGYRVSGLAPTSTGYIVCFDALQARGGSSAGGYRSQCYRNRNWDGQYYDLPPGTTLVTVSIGATHRAVNARLVAGAAISGIVTSDDGGNPLQDVDVQVYRANGEFAAEMGTNPDGSYQVDGLAPSTTYRVCFDASYASGGPSAAGYLDECYDNVPWDGSSDPTSTATPVSVTTGSLSSGIDAALGDAGGVSGRVTSAASGNGVADVEVDAYDSADNIVGYTYTASSGQYLLGGLPGNATGYSICFNASSAHGGGSTTGYVSECYDNVPWDGYTDPTSTATPVPVTPGSVSSTINASLGAAGGIAGKVTAAAGGAALADVDVFVTTTDGVYLTDTSTRADGTYRFIGIPPSSTGYDVCFDPTNATGGTSSTGYVSQCYNNQPWNSGSEPPAGATLVTVAAGAVHGGVNARVRSGAAIQGTVTASGGGAIGDVYAIVFAGTDFVGAASTSAVDGTYQVGGLAAGTYHVCFDAADADSPPGTGYADECWSDTAWDGRYGAVPAGARAVVLRSGATRVGVDAALGTAGAITGQITSAATGDAMVDGAAYVYDSTGFVTYGRSDESGTYRVRGLNPDVGPYTVCFRDDGDHAGSPTGYAPQCYQGISWTGSPTLPASTTGVSVTAGGTTTGIDAVLTKGGAISGKITDATTGEPATDVYPTVFDTAGHRVADGYAGDSGTYRFNGLAPGQYVVCFTVDNPQYAAQCWNNLGWDNLPEDIPSDATVITVNAGGMRGNINASMTPPPQ